MKLFYRQLRFKLSKIYLFYIYIFILFYSEIYQWNKCFPSFQTKSIVSFSDGVSLSVSVLSGEISKTILLMLTFYSLRRHSCIIYTWCSLGEIIFRSYTETRNYFLYTPQNVHAHENIILWLNVLQFLFHWKFWIYITK